jgi:hypothetical protein
MNLVPGSNLLKKAFQVIAKQPFIYRQFKENTRNDIGVDVPSYEADVDIEGSIQPVPRTLYQAHGLNWKKNYITIYCDTVIEGPKRDASGDLIISNGDIYQALEENNWNPADGWNGVIFVQVSL